MEYEDPQYRGEDDPYADIREDAISWGYRDEVVYKPAYYTREQARLYMDMLKKHHMPRTPSPLRVYIRRNLKRIYIRRRARGVPFEFEWHNYHDIRFLSIAISSPREYKWWATHITIYTSLGHGPNLLGWIPSYIYRYGWKR